MKGVGIIFTNEKPKKQVFSFRTDKSKIDEWNLYADVVGAKNLGEFWTKVIDDYIKSHELTASQQVIYALKKQAAEMQEK